MDFLSEMIERFTEKRAIDWLRFKFPSFDTSKAKPFPVDSSKNERDYFSSANVLGYVETLPEGKSKPDNKPLVVVVVKMAKGKLMTERTCRSVQFNFAKRVLQTEVNHAAKGLDGLPSQGLFFFVDEDGYFRLSLVTGAVENRRFKVNETKRQSFFVDPSAANNIVRRRLDGKIATFEALKEAFSVEQLTKEFYGKLFDWYTWAMAAETRVNFPNDLDDDTDDRKYNNEAIIRLITRLMFTWFIRQRKLVPDALFDQAAMGDILKKFDPNSMEDGNYYRAILQNLFFATFNCPQEGKDKLTRRWINVQTDASGNGTGLTNDYRVTTVYRYKSEFKNPDRFLEMMRKVPFLNCALFDCLDRIQRPIDGGKKLFFDGFSSRPKRQAFVPNGLFFNEERGLISLFNRYEFTVDENNADDADVALDPELLGKVFENLLGAYNPETKETARNATGSFYTPREIVDYMVEESLKNYLKTKVPAADDKRLEDLFDKAKAADRLPTLFSRKETDELLNAIYSCKILDPACGSGAFPMGILHAMVRLLGRLDPDCLSIREQLLKRYREDKAIIDPAETQAEREERLAELEKRLEEGQHYPDYERKLYLIENCIYGVDIQAIATQISKLRFFISLLCDQLKRSFDPEAENYGLLSLPNLEAKFVCANTLISLPEVGALDAAVGNIQELREELQANRHKIFRARSFRTKEKYKAKDLEIRDAIRQTVIDSLSKPDEDVIARRKEQIAAAEERRKAVAEPKWVKVDIAVQTDLFSSYEKQTIEKDENATERAKIDAEIEWAKGVIKKEEDKGKPDNAQVATSYANMVAGWDPYDQNASSKWFDSEWMFNIGSGFDIVIGNPPYVLIDKSVYSTLYAPFFKYQSGKIDLYRLFIEKGVALLSKVSRSVLSYITPNTFLTIPSCKLLREHLLQGYTMRKIVNYDEDVFEGVSVNSVVFIAQVGEPKDSQFIYISPNGDLARFYPISQADCLKNDNCAIRIFQDAQTLSVLKKMMLSGRTLGDADIDICLGEQPYHNTIHTKDQMNRRFLHADHRVNESYLQELGGRDISRYGIDRSRQIYLDYSAELYTKPQMKYFTGERIIIREIPAETLICAYTTDEFLVNKSCYVIKNECQDISYTTLLAILNSRLVGFWIANSGEKTKQNLFPRISMASLKLIPLPEISDEENNTIGKLALQVINMKTSERQADTSALEAEIDRLVYKLYGLTEEEIAIVEGTSAKKEPEVSKTKLPRRAKKQSAAVEEPHEEEEELE